MERKFASMIVGSNSGESGDPANTTINDANCIRLIFYREKEATYRTCTHRDDVDSRCRKEYAVRYRSSSNSVKRDGESAMPVKGDHDQVMWCLLYNLEHVQYANVNCEDKKIKLVL